MDERIPDEERDEQAPIGDERLAGGGESCSNRAGMNRASVKRNQQICATCVPVVMWIR